MKLLSLFGAKPKDSPPSEVEALVQAERVKQAQAFIESATSALSATWPIDLPGIVILLNYENPTSSITVQITRPVHVPMDPQ